MRWRSSCPGRAARQIVCSLPTPHPGQRSSTRTAAGGTAGDEASEAVSADATMSETRTTSMEMPMRDSDADSSSTRDCAGPAPVGDWSLSVEPRLSPDGGDLVSGAAAARAPAQRQALTAISVGQKSILPNPHQPLGNNVHREPAHEFHCAQRHLLASAAVGIVLPGKGDLIVLELHQAAIAQGDSVRVPSQVFQHLFRPAEGLLGIDNPIFLVQRPYQCRPKPLGSSGARCSLRTGVGRLGKPRARPPGTCRGKPG